MASRKDYYKILGFPDDKNHEEITHDEIKKQYRKKARELHPDLHPYNPQAQNNFKELNEAYEILGNRAKRQVYDFLHRPATPPEDLQTSYNKLNGLKGFGKKALSAASAIMNIIMYPLGGALLAGVATILALPALVALWFKPKWLARTLHQDENKFESVSKRILLSFILFPLIVLSPVIILGYTIKKTPKKFKEIAVHGLSRKEKGELFGNVVLITALLLVTFPPAGFAIVLGAFGAAATGMHMSGMATTFFVWSSQLIGELISYSAKKLYDFFDGGKTNRKKEPYRSAPEKPAAAPVARSTPALLLLEFPNKNKPSAAHRVSFAELKYSENPNIISTARTNHTAPLLSVAPSADSSVKQSVSFTN